MGLSADLVLELLQRGGQRRDEGLVDEQQVEEAVVAYRQPDTVSHAHGQLSWKREHTG